ncbi:MAG: insulinase family protein [Alphaproteobacteria bacterium]|nr:insulinase family protein [Alphaproteobacteria bacterium]
MSGYSSRRRGFFYYFKWVVFLSSVACGWYYAPHIWLKFHQIDAEAIISSSKMKNKKFSGTVQEVKSSEISAYLLEEHSVPIVSMNFDFTNAGSAHEADEKQGLTDILTKILLDGAGRYDAVAFKDICEEYGIKIGFNSGVDEISGYLHFPKQNMEMALKMLDLVLQKPRFDEEFITLRKQQLKTAVKMSLENPQAILADKFSEFIFAGHPYSRTQAEMLETIDDIGKQDMIDFMQTHLSRENLIIGIAGDVSVEETEDILQRIFTKLPKKYQGEKMSEINIEFGGREYNVEKDTAQAMTVFATKGTYRNSVDFYPLYIANYVFGGSGLNSRISQIIREKEGLTYGIYTTLTESDAVAMIQGSYSATADNFKKARKLLLSEWQKIATQGITEEELQQAKDSLISSFNLRFASISNIASMLTAMQKYKIGRDFLEKRNDYIKTVTLQEVNAAAKKYFSVTPDFVNIGIKTEEKQ